MVQRHLINQRGSAIVFALGFMMVTLVIALGVQTLVVEQLQMSGMLRQRVSAEYLAQGGVARALGWFKSQGYVMPQAASLTATVPVELTSNNAAVVLPSNHPDSYTDLLGQAQSGVVSSFNTYLTSQAANGGSYSVTATLMSAQPETWELLATAQQGVAQRQVGAILTRGFEPLFQDALFGRDGVTVNSSMTDSYDASLGPYGGANRFQTGNVRSNAGITLGGGAIVNGDAIPGPNMTVTLNGGSSVTGFMTPAQTPRLLPPAVIPSGAVTIPTIKLSGGGKQTLSSGTYVVDSISITGSGELKIDTTGGPVNLFVTGSIHVGGKGIVNLRNSPTDLSITQVGGATVALAGGSDFYGTVYAPDSALTVGGGAQLFGGFIGASITITGSSGSAIHYDRVVRNIVTLSPFRLVSEWTLQS